jgi:hypothetical protein
MSYLNYELIYINYETLRNKLVLYKIIEYLLLFYVLNNFVYLARAYFPALLTTISYQGCPRYPEITRETTPSM